MGLQLFTKYLGLGLGRSFYIMFTLTIMVMIIDTVSNILHSAALGILATFGALIIFYYIKKKAKVHIFILNTTIDKLLHKLKIRLREKHYYDLIIKNYHELLSIGADFSDMSNKKVVNFDKLVYDYIEYGMYNYSDIAKIYMNSLIYGSNQATRTYGLAILYSQLSTKRRKLDNYYNLMGDIFSCISQSNSIDKFFKDVNLYMNYTLEDKLAVEEIKQKFYSDLPAEYQLGIMV